MKDENYTHKEVWKLQDKIIRKELSICETCDTFFKYTPRKIFCDECAHERKKSRKLKYSEKNREKKAAYDRKYYAKKKQKRDKNES